MLSLFHCLIILDRLDLYTADTPAMIVTMDLAVFSGTLSRLIVLFIIECLQFAEAFLHLLGQNVTAFFRGENKC